MNHSNKKMLFITLEGPEGSGKTTIIKCLQEKLSQSGILVFITREPGGSKISESIRKILLNNENEKMDSWTEVLLYIAARRQHFIEQIQPKLEKGEIIICDRFSDSTLAYQGFGRGLDTNKIALIQNIALGEFEPSLTIYLDIDPEVGLQRAAKRGIKGLNRLDYESIQFHHRVFEGYKKLALTYPDRIKVVDAKRKFILVLQEVFEIIVAQISLFYNLQAKADNHEKSSQN